MASLHSCIYETKVRHTRLEPVFHSFEYPVYFYVFDLDELTTLSTTLSPLFGYNLFRPISLYDADYLTQNISLKDDSLNKQSIKQKLFRKLAEKEIDHTRITRVELVTVPRYLGYAFNPVSFYYCYCMASDGGEKISHIVSEINNTFGEKHIYVHSVNADLKDTKKRNFHVSPFNDLDMSYR